MPSTSDLPPDPPPRTPAQRLRRLLLLPLRLLAGLGGWLLADHLNRSARQPLPEQTVRVLLARAVPASERSVGGTEVYFEAPSTPAEPQRLLAEGLALERFKPGSSAQLHAEAGRWWGRWGRLAPRG